MPDQKVVVATVSEEIVHKDLNTVAGGFVEIRPLPYGKVLHRRENATRMSLEQDTSRGKRSQQTQKLDLEMMQEWTRQYEFKECIVNHNLGDKTGRLLDFNNPMDLQFLDPKVGQEIERYIDELNVEEDEEDMQAFLASPTSSSKEGKESNNDSLVSPVP